MRLYLRRVLAPVYSIEEWMPPSAMEIVDYLKESAPDVVLTDYLMPGCNGVTVARMAMKAKPGLPVLVLTANRDEDVATQLRKFQVAEILYKPASPEAILAAVGKAVGTQSLSA